MRLREAGGEGRLTLEELAERVERADGARTRADLDALTADLPDDRPGPALPAEPQTERRWLVAVMGGVERKGRWRPSRRTNVIAVMGGVSIDLREAELADGVEILAIPVMGGISITVPPGVSVEIERLRADGRQLRPATTSCRRCPTRPIVRVRAFSLMGDVTVARKKSRELG